MIDTPFLTEEKLMESIVLIMSEGNVNSIDAIIEFCNKNLIDIEDIKPLIGPSLKERIRVDAMDTGLMRKESKLEF